MQIFDFLIENRYTLGVTLLVGTLFLIIFRSKWAKIRFDLMFTDPLADLKKLLPELKTLQVQLSELRGSRAGVLYGYSGIKAIVPFFNLTSPWHDRSGELVALIQGLQRLNIDKRFDVVIENLATLRTHFERAGRQPYGHNRSRVGQIVTADQVYLGDIFGIWTFNVTYWLAQSGMAKGGWGFHGMDHLSPYDVVGKQASDFIDSHAIPMAEVVEKLQSACNNPAFAPKSVLSRS